MKNLFEFCIPLFLALIPSNVKCIDHAETRLLANLFGPSYDSRARPSFNARKPVNVDFRLDLRQIYEVSETSQTVSLLTSTYQEWRDPRLKWNASDYDGLDSFSIYYSYLWTPDTTLYTTVDMYRQNVEDRENAVVKSDNSADGALIQVIYNTRHTIGCRFNMKYFPFDEQNCTFIFGSWTYDESQLNYSVINHVTTEGYRESDEWMLISFNMLGVSEKYECCTYPYKVLYAHLVIRRKCLYYVFNLILPTVIINIMASFGLFASPGNESNRHDKLQIGITTLLSYCILLLTVSGEIPRGSTAIPLISWFFFSVMVQNAIKMYVAIFLSYPSRRRYVRSIFRFLRDKTIYRTRISRTVAIKKTPIERAPINQQLVEDEDDDRLQELICLWVSVGCLAGITMIMFGVAYSR